MDNQIRELSKKNERKRMFKRVVSLLCVIVLLFTMNTLKRSANTLERIPMCGMEEHIHDSGCYNEAGELVCGRQEHVHTDACYQESPKKKGKSGELDVKLDGFDNTGNLIDSGDVQSLDLSANLDHEGLLDFVRDTNGSQGSDNAMEKIDGGLLSDIPKENAQESQAAVANNAGETQEVNFEFSGEIQGNGAQMSSIANVQQPAADAGQPVDDDQQEEAPAVVGQPVDDDQQEEAPAVAGQPVTDEDQQEGETVVAGQPVTEDDQQEEEPAVAGKPVTDDDQQEEEGPAVAGQSVDDDQQEEAPAVGEQPSDEEQQEEEPVTGEQPADDEQQEEGLVVDGEAVTDEQQEVAPVVEQPASDDQEPVAVEQQPTSDGDQQEELAVTGQPVSEDDGQEEAPAADEQPADDEQQEEVPATGEQPADEEQQEEAPATGEQPADGEQQEEAPAAGEQPADEEKQEEAPAAGEQTADEEQQEEAPDVAGEPDADGEQEAQSAERRYTATVDLAETKTYPISLRGMIANAVPAEGIEPATDDAGEQTEPEDVAELPVDKWSIEFDPGLFAIETAEDDVLVTPQADFESAEIIISNGSRYELTLVNCALEPAGDASEVEAEPEIARPAQHFEQATDYISVVVDAPEGAFPEGTVMVVRDVVDQETIDNIEQRVTEDFVEVKSVHAVDISFWYNDVEIEPSTPISVVMSAVEVEKQQQTQDAVVVHVADDGDAQVVDSETTGTAEASLEMPAGEPASQAFEADSFSVYALVMTEKIETKYIDDAGETWSIKVGFTKDARIPAGATLQVSEVTDESYLAEAEAALESGKRITKARFFDIRIMDGDREVQPEDKVQVTVSLEGDEGTVEIDPETQEETEVGDPEVCAMHFVEENDAVVKVETQDATETEDGVTFNAEGFSVWGVVYTVEFHNGDDEVVIQGGSQVLLSALIERLGLVRANGDAFDVDDVVTVEFTEPELFTVEEVFNGDEIRLHEKILSDASDGGVDPEADSETQGDADKTVIIETRHDFVITSEQPFEESSMILTLTDGEVIRVGVTDAQNSITYTTVIDFYDANTTNTETGIKMAPDPALENYYYVLAMIKKGHDVYNEGTGQSTYREDYYWDIKPVDLRNLHSDSISVSFDTLKNVDGTDDTYALASNDGDAVYTRLINAGTTQLDADGFTLTLNGDANSYKVNTENNNYPGYSDYYLSHANAQTPLSEQLEDTYSFFGVATTSTNLETGNVTKRINVKVKSSDYAYMVRLRFGEGSTASIVNYPDVEGSNDKTNNRYYVLVEVTHSTSGKSYSWASVAGAVPTSTDGGWFYRDIPITEWYNANGDLQANEVFTGHEPSIKVSLIKSYYEENSFRYAQFSNASDLTDGYSHIYNEGAQFHGYTVGYDTRASRGDDAYYTYTTTVDGKTVTVCYDQIDLTPQTIEAEYDYRTILGPNVYYGIVAEHLYQPNHLQTNFAVNHFSGHGHDVRPDLSGKVSGGNIVIGEFNISDGSKRNSVGEVATDPTWGRLKVGKPLNGTLLVYADNDSGYFEGNRQANVYDNPEQTVVVPVDGKSLSESIVEPGIQYMQQISATLAGKAVNYQPTLSGNTALIDTTAFDEYATIYIDGDSIKAAVETTGGITINKKDHQTIIFNFDNKTTSRNLTISQFTVNQPSFAALGYPNGYKTDSPEATGSNQNKVMDDIARHIVWNLAACTRKVTIDTAGGIFLQPNDNSEIEIKGTTAGWIVSDGYVYNGTAEWHNVFEEMLESNEVHLNALKLLNGKLPVGTQYSFTLDMLKYGNPDLEGKPQSREWINVETRQNESATVTFNNIAIGEGEKQLKRGWNIFRICEVGGVSGTITDSTVFYAAVYVDAIVTALNNFDDIHFTVSEPKYYTAFDETAFQPYNDGSSDHYNAALTGVSGPFTNMPIFENETITNGLTLLKKVNGTDAANKVFTFAIEMWHEGENGKKTALNADELSDLTIAPGRWSVDPAARTGESEDTYTYAEVKLQNGKKVTIDGLPQGVKYRITEIKIGGKAINSTNADGNGYIDSYKPASVSADGYAEGQEPEITTGADGTISITGTIIEQEATYAVTYVNEYKAAGDIDLAVKKTLKNESDALMLLADNMFAFTLTRNGRSFTAYNKADGTIEFPAGALSFTQDDMAGATMGADGYMSKEVDVVISEGRGTLTDAQIAAYNSTNSANFDYDKVSYQADKVVTLVLTDKGDGTIEVKPRAWTDYTTPCPYETITTYDETGTATVSYSVTFDNKLVKKAHTTIEGVKTMVGEKLSEAQFTFNVKLIRVNGTDVSDAALNAAGITDEQITNINNLRAQASPQDFVGYNEPTPVGAATAERYTSDIVFPTVYYTQTGTYVYEITEDASGLTSGVIQQEGSTKTYYAQVQVNDLDSAPNVTYWKSFTSGSLGEQVQSDQNQKMTFINEKVNSFKVTKSWLTAGKTAATGVKTVTFSVYNVNVSGRPQLTFSDLDGKVTKKDDSNASTAVALNADGSVTLTSDSAGNWPVAVFTDLPIGRYQIVETDPSASNEMTRTYVVDNKSSSVGMVQTGQTLTITNQESNDTYTDITVDKLWQTTAGTTYVPVSGSATFELMEVKTETVAGTDDNTIEYKEGNIRISGPKTDNVEVTYSIDCGSYDNLIGVYTNLNNIYLANVKLCASLDSTGNMVSPTYDVGNIAPSSPEFISTDMQTVKNAIPDNHVYTLTMKFSIPTTGADFDVGAIYANAFNNMNYSRTATITSTAAAAPPVESEKARFTLNNNNNWSWKSPRLPVSLNNGATTYKYYIEEIDVPAGTTVSYSVAGTGNKSGLIDGAGGSATLTATNTTQPGTLKLKKVVTVNDVDQAVRNSGDTDYDNGQYAALVDGAYDFKVTGPLDETNMVVKYVRIHIMGGHIGNVEFSDDGTSFGNTVNYDGSNKDRWAVVEGLTPGRYEIEETGAYKRNGVGLNVVDTPRADYELKGIDSSAGAGDAATGKVIVTVTAGDTAAAWATFTNNYETVTISAHKIWQDDATDEEPNFRDADMEFELQSKVGDGAWTKAAAYADGTGISDNPKKLHASDNWTATWDNLPKYQGSTEIEYRVVEIKLWYNNVDYHIIWDGDSYTVRKDSLDGEVCDSWLITQSFDPETGMFTFTNTLKGALKLKKVVTVNGASKTDGYADGNYFFSIKDSDDHVVKYVRINISGGEPCFYELGDDYSTWHQGRDGVDGEVSSDWYWTHDGTVFFWNDDYSWNTDLNGYAIVSDLTPGDYTITELATGNGTSLTAVARGDGDAAAVDLPESKVVVHVTAGVVDPDEDTDAAASFTNNKEKGALKLKKVVHVNGSDPTEDEQQYVNGAYDFSVVGPTSAALGDQTTKYVRIIVRYGKMINYQVADNRNDLSYQGNWDGFDNDDNDRWVTIAGLDLGDYVVTELNAYAFTQLDPLTVSATPRNDMALEDITGGKQTEDPETHASANDADLAAKTVTLTVTRGDTPSAEAAVTYTNNRSIGQFSLRKIAVPSTGIPINGDYEKVGGDYCFEVYGPVGATNQPVDASGAAISDCLTHYYVKITATPTNYDTRLKKHKGVIYSCKISTDNSTWADVSATGEDYSFENGYITFKKLINGAYYIVKETSWTLNQSTENTAMVLNGLWVKKTTQAGEVLDETAVYNLSATPDGNMPAHSVKLTAGDQARNVSAAFENDLVPNTMTHRKMVLDVNDSSDTDPFDTTSERTWEDSADYDIGDKIPYRVTGYLPQAAYKAAESYYYRIDDVMQNLEYATNSGHMFAFVKGPTDEVGRWYMVDGYTDDQNVYHEYFKVTTPSVDATGAVQNDGDDTIKYLRVETTPNAGLKAINHGYLTTWGDADTHENKIADAHWASAASEINPDHIQYLQFRYDAQLLSTANIGVSGNANDAKIYYGNRATPQSTGWDRNRVFTYRALINKTYVDDEQGNSRTDFANFALYKKYKRHDAMTYSVACGNVTARKAVTLWANSADNLPKDGDGLVNLYPETNTYHTGNFYFVGATVSNGRQFEWDGIDDGDYILVELSAPDGYIPMATPIEFTIEAAHDRESNDPELHLDSGTYLQVWPEDTTVYSYFETGDTAVKFNSGNITLNIPNRPYKIDIRIEKVSTDATPLPLNGAVFKLTKFKGMNGETENWEAVTGVATSNVDSEGRPVLTDSEGKFTVNGNITLKDLRDGRYKLEETASPAGYIITNRYPVAFTIKDGKVVSGSNALTSGVTYTAKREATQTQAAVDTDTYTIPNEAGASLPATGGIGTGWIYGAGAGLMLLAVLGLMLTHRKRREGAGIR